MTKINRHGEESTSYNTIADLADSADRCDECGEFEGWCRCLAINEEEYWDISYDDLRNELEGREYNPDDQIDHFPSRK